METEVTRSEKQEIGKAETGEYWMLLFMTPAPVHSLLSSGPRTGIVADFTFLAGQLNKHHVCEQIKLGWEGAGEQIADFSS